MGFCIAGACLEVANLDPLEPSALGWIHRVLGGGASYKNGGLQWRQTDWNDQPERTKEEVVTALRRLADGATWEEAIA